MRFANVLAVGMSVIALAACQNMVSRSGVYYNVGLSEASNNLLLTNIIRSAKGYPIYYSVIGDYSSSRSISASPSASASIPLDMKPETNVDLSIGPSVGQDQNANVSSLETDEFMLAMHTQVDPELMSFLLDSHNNSHSLLVLTLVIKNIVITRADFEKIIQAAENTCEQGFQGYSSLGRGTCDNFEELRRTQICDLRLLPSANGSGVRVNLSNSATNRCAYTQFRTFIEALSLNDVSIRQDRNGGIDIFFNESPSSTIELFDPEGTGFVLHSPNGIVQYLGEIVNDQFAGTRQWTPEVTNRSGKSVPIFKLGSGPVLGQASVSARIDGELFWIPSRKLGAEDEDMSYRSLMVIKDFQTLNTAQDQLPDSPTILLGPR